MYAYANGSLNLLEEYYLLDVGAKVNSKSLIR